jgi:2,4-dienoyl-CoA reductase-like NADH-dependent reductase (Old Yellow Enzyme family)
MTESTLRPLLTPVWMGDLLLPNRIVMEPIAGMRRQSWARARCCRKA